MDEIEKTLRETCPECGEQVFPLEHVLQHCNFDRNGVVIELGVASGKTLNMLAAHLPDNQHIFGFDSFEGLPEAWNDGGMVFHKGAFSTGGSLPSVPSHVHIVKGLFQDTLPAFKADVLKQQAVALLHVDCDLYASAKCAFDVLKDNIQDGTVIVFDELWNYPDYRNHEMKAFAELLRDKSVWFEPLTCRRRSSWYKEVAVVIRSNPSTH